MSQNDYIPLSQFTPEMMERYASRLSDQSLHDFVNMPHNQTPHYETVRRPAYLAEMARRRLGITEREERWTVSRLKISSGICMSG